MEFDTNNISDSISVLLSGLKVAFLSTLGGLSANLVLKTSPSKFGYASKEKSEDDLGQAIVSSLNGLTKAISGDAENSLYSVLMLSRTETKDALSKLNTSFDDFAKKVVTDSTQSLIGALENVISDFNNKITEQFGDNFKQLNSAVGSMLEWQKEYKNHVNKSTRALNDVVSSLSDIDASISTISENSSSINEVNKTLKKVLEDVSGSLISLKEIGDEAKTSFPVIKTHMENLVKESNDFINKSTAKLSGQYDSFEETQTTLMNSYKASLDTMISDSKDRIVKLDTELGNALTKSLTSLGDHLTSLSSQFVKDYGPLTKDLKQIVDIAKLGQN
jgi:methyl-accepting chemotaxis protein